MKKVWKDIYSRVLPVVLCAVLFIVFSASAFAESGKPERETGKAESGKPERETGKPDWAGEKREEQEKEREQEKEQAQERVKKTYRGISTEKIALAIESVTDEATKAELTAMLDAYIAALSEKDAALAEGGMSMSELSQLASAARSSLKDALEEAGFTLGSVLGWQEWKDYGNEALDLDEIALVISTLDDLDENKTALQLLLASYQSALIAQEAATEEEEDMLREQAEAARDALLEALHETGIFPIAQQEAEIDDKPLV
ncbi:MAG: hypothetical protein Q8S22_03135 [Eubacteriales bacterium]|nr:hypothetical protein [Eubacteriales bacterium]